MEGTQNSQLPAQIQTQSFIGDKSSSSVSVHVNVCAEVGDMNLHIKVDSVQDKS